MTKIPISLLRHHPLNPRLDLSNLDELTDSIRKNGLFQNITVTPSDDGLTYNVIIGNRRLEAAMQAGLEELPCEIIAVSEDEAVSMMLQENMMRENLNTYEEAQGFQMMMDLGKSIAEISEMSGFSDSTVRKRVKLADLDKDEFKEAVERGATLFDFTELDKIENNDIKNAVLKKAGTNNFNSELQKAINKQNNDKYLQEVIDKISAYAEPIDSTDYNTNGYVAIRDDEEVAIVHNFYTFDTYSKKDLDKEIAPDKKYFYKVSTYGSGGSIYLYEEGTLEDTKTEEQILREAINDTNDTIRNALVEKEKAFRQLRYNFVKNFSATKKAKEKIKEFFFAAMIQSANGVSGRRFNQDVIAEMLDIELEGEGYCAKLPNNKIMEKFKDNPEYAMLVIAYGIFDTGFYYDYKWNNDDKLTHYIHLENDCLDTLYKYLKILGYEESDEESDYRDGIDSLFDYSWFYDIVGYPGAETDEEEEISA